MLIDYESYIPIDSKIVDRTIREVEEKFGVKINHYHNSPVEIETKRFASPDVVLKPGMSIKLCDVDSEELDKFCIYFDLP